MTRIIKFRAWDKKEKQMYSTVALGKAQYTSRVFSTVSIDSWLYDVNAVLGEAIKELEVMQFTGLLDKNGKEIYEGDIVKAHFFGFNGSETDNEVTGQISSLQKVIW